MDFMPLYGQGDADWLRWLHGITTEIVRSISLGMRVVRAVTLELPT